MPKERYNSEDLLGYYLNRINTGPLTSSMELDYQTKCIYTFQKPHDDTIILGLNEIYPRKNLLPYAFYAFIPQPNYSGFQVMSFAPLPTGEVIDIRQDPDLLSEVLKQEFPSRYLDYPNKPKNNLRRAQGIERKYSYISIPTVMMTLMMADDSIEKSFAKLQTTQGISPDTGLSIIQHHARYFYDRL